VPETVVTEGAVLKSVCYCPSFEEGPVAAIKKMERYRQLAAPREVRLTSPAAPICLKVALHLLNRRSDPLLEVGETDHS
jgi:hypothetical protein